MAGSTILITVNGVDVTSKVIFASASFTLQSNARPGTCEFTVSDRQQTLSFTTGKEIQLSIDGVLMWGGYLTSVSYKHAFPAVDTSREVTDREFVLRGVDYNILFDRLVLRNTAEYRLQIPRYDVDRYDGDLITNELCAKYLDIPAGFDTSTYVDNVVPPRDPLLLQETTGTGAWLSQGTPWRKSMEDFAQFSGAVWYIDGAKNLHYHGLDNVVALWGFSDTPNRRTVTLSSRAGECTYGFRELDASEDGSTLANDALIWGGSQWAGSGETVFARVQDATSESVHGRWQRAEIHFGEDGYKLQSGVDARANVIVFGDPGSVGGNPDRGLRYPQWQIRLTWFGHDTPVVSGDPNFLIPGDVVTFVFFTMGIIRELPLRQLSISFPNLDPNGDAYVKFTGMFSLQLDDPFTLWRFLMDRQPAAFQAGAVLSTADASTTDSVYGQLYNGAFDESPTGARFVFSLPNDLTYIAGSTQVVVNGALQRPGHEYTESDPTAGEVSFASPPRAADQLWIVCYLA